jgi:hypothetical protein
MGDYQSVNRLKTSHIPISHYDRIPANSHVSNQLPR